MWFGLAGSVLQCRQGRPLKVLLRLFVIKSFAAGIVRLLGDDQLSRRLAKNALQLAAESYSPEAYHAKIAEVCAFLVSRARKNNLPPSPPGVARH